MDSKADMNPEKKSPPRASHSSRLEGSPEDELLNMIIELCYSLAWGRPAEEDILYALTRIGSAPDQYVRLAEAFGMMLVKVDAREFHREQLIKELQRSKEEVEEVQRLLAERNKKTVHDLKSTVQARRVVGQSPEMRKALNMALAVAKRPVNTLILGATGTGKEVIAETIHCNSPRKDGPFVAVNCTAIPDSLFESEMFGIEKGVATGVLQRRGLVEEAHGGTLFLDELADMSLANQAKLLRVLEEREVLRVGSVKPVPVDIKVIAATNVNLEKSVRDGAFREDLYYRINVAEINLPPLRQRGNDILLLAQVFLEKFCAQFGRACLSLSTDAQESLLHYPWPGNVRELSNEMERAVALTEGMIITASDFSARLQNCNMERTVEEQSTAVTFSEQEHLEKTPSQSFNLREAERALVLKALAFTKNNKSQAAEVLGITREGLRKKLLRLGIQDE